MQFRVPQFIDIEDKIFGPFTFKQFAYLLGGLGAGFIIFRLIPYGGLAIIFSAPPVVLGLLLAFYKPNNKPFANMLEAWGRYTITKKLYLWQKVEPERKILAEKKEEEKDDERLVPKITESKLKEISWGLDVLDNK